MESDIIFLFWKEESDIRKIYILDPILIFLKYARRILRKLIVRTVTETGTVNGTGTAVMMNTTDLYYEFNQNPPKPTTHMHAYRHVLELATFYTCPRTWHPIYIYIYIQLCFSSPNQINTRSITSLH